jgi:hypothetical protein
LVLSGPKTLLETGENPNHPRLAALAGGGCHRRPRRALIGRPPAAWKTLNPAADADRDLRLRVKVTRPDGDRACGA